MKHSLATALLLCLITGASLQAQDITRTFKEGFAYTEDGRVPFSVDIKMTPFDQSYHQGGPYYGREEGLPAYVCEEFSLTINGRPLAIPRESFSDLSEILDFESPYQDENSSWIILVTGGDGGGAYEVEMVFDDTRLLQRRFVIYNSDSGERVYYDIKNF
jgi:hypothetical protein